MIFGCRTPIISVIVFTVTSQNKVLMINEACIKSKNTDFKSIRIFIRLHNITIMGIGGKNGK